MTTYNTFDNRLLENQEKYVPEKYASTDRKNELSVSPFISNETLCLQNKLKITKLDFIRRFLFVVEYVDSRKMKNATFFLT